MAKPILCMAGAFLLGLAVPASAQGNAAAGAIYFQGRCGLCHAIQADRGETLGPNLYGFYGRKAASRPAYRRMYSRELRRSHIVWTDAALDKWLTNPAAMVPGTHMRGFPGISLSETRASVIAFLSTLK